MNLTQWQVSDYLSTVPLLRGPPMWTYYTMRLFIRLSVRPISLCSEGKIVKF